VLRLWRATAATGVSVLALASAAPADAAITYVNSNSIASTNTTLTITKPASLATNDVMIATISMAGTNATTAPSGWILIEDTTNASNVMRTQTYYKVATASEGASYAWTTASNRNWTGGIIALRGANPNVPIDSVTEAIGASGNVNAPAITTTSANEWIVTSVAANRNTTFTANATTTERYDRAGTSTSNEVATSTQASAGTVAAKAVVPANTTSPWAAHTIAVRDAAAAGLSVSLASASETFSASLDSGDSTQTYPVDLTVEDTRTGTGAGWQLQVTSTTLTTGTHSLATTATDITAISTAACNNLGPCTLPTNSVTYPVGVPAAASAPTAVKFANAAATTGRSRIDWSATFAVDVPQNAFAGSYTSTVTISVISGP
jgi:hypothetical protein